MTKRLKRNLLGSHGRLTVLRIPERVRLSTEPAGNTARKEAASRPSVHRPIRHTADSRAYRKSQTVAASGPPSPPRGLHVKADRDRRFLINISNRLSFHEATRGPRRAWAGLRSLSSHFEVIRPKCGWPATAEATSRARPVPNVFQCRCTSFAIAAGRHDHPKQPENAMCDPCRL